jgi:3-hydroxyacyl-[acyl-carrier-protein] dehydratase
MASIERMFTSDHPAAEGHFPGNPIIPGAVLLSTMLDAIGSELRVSLSPCRIKAAKFYSPVRPGDSVVIRFTGAASGDVRFECAVRGRKVLTGHVECSAAPENP